MEILTTSDFCKKEYGEKLYKISLSAAFTCPNRDGSKDTRGCIFCSEGGSGDFAQSCEDSISDQIEKAKERVKNKFKGDHYIAYFQSFTNTYAPLNYLKSVYDPLLDRDDISVISIATRPDCLSDEILEYLGELNSKKPLWVELGLQTVNEKSIEYIRRCYDTSEYDKAITKLNKMGIHTITHIILGLPGETKEDMKRSVQHSVDMKTKGIKLQLLHVLENTDLADDYRKGLFKTLEMDEYISILCDCLKIIPSDIVIHRMTGDGPKKILIAPLWSADKKKVINNINKAIIQL